MKVLIVGFGGSMNGSDMGTYIDKFSGSIVRLIGSSDKCTPEDFGSRVPEYLCSTTYQFRYFDSENVVLPTTQLWLYVTSGGVIISRAKFGSLEVYVDSLAKFVGFYNDIRDKDKFTSGKFSKGLAAIIMAVSVVPDLEEIYLCGFDNLLKGSNDDYVSMSRLRGKTRVVNHDFSAEKEIMRMVVRQEKIKLFRLFSCGGRIEWEERW